MLNPNEIQCIFIGSRQLSAQAPPNTVFSIDEDIITPSAPVKYLDVYMDKFMRFAKHTDISTKNVVGVFMFLSRVSANFDKPSRIIVVQ